MILRCFLVLGLALFATNPATLFANEDASGAEAPLHKNGLSKNLLPATEILLPGYQAAALARDTPLTDLYMMSHDSLWLLGKTALWHWQFNERKLRRLPLPAKAKEGAGHDQSRLRHLSSDGIHLFAASSHTLYQYHPGMNRVFRYEHPATRLGTSLGFSGSGDNFWWLHEKAVLKVDRYGKAIVPRHIHSLLQKGDTAVLDLKRTRLLYARKNQILVASLTDKERKPRSFFKTKHQLLDLQQDGDGFVAHTASTVLRLSSTGKLTQSIPVEGKRTLVRMSISDTQHAYLFSDQLLEVFDLETKSVRRYLLPINDGKHIGSMSLRDRVLAVITDGNARVFKLGG